MYNCQLREKITTTTHTPSPGNVLFGQYPRRTLQIPNCSVRPSWFYRKQWKMSTVPRLGSTTMALVNRHCNIIQDDINTGILTCLLCHGFSLVKAAISPQIVHLPRTMDQLIAPRVAGFPTPTLDIVKIVLWRNNGGSKLMFVCFHSSKLFSGIFFFFFFFLFFFFSDRDFSFLSTLFFFKQI